MADDDLGVVAGSSRRAPNPDTCRRETCDEQHRPEEYETQSFHGTGYENWRHEQFNAKNFFDNYNKIPKTPYRYFKDKADILATVRGQAFAKFDSFLGQAKSGPTSRLFNVPSLARPDWRAASAPPQSPSAPAKELAGSAQVFLVPSRHRAPGAEPSRLVCWLGKVEAGPQVAQGREWLMCPDWLA